MSLDWADGTGGFSWGQDPMEGFQRAGNSRTQACFDILTAQSGSESHICDFSSLSKSNNRSNCLAQCQFQLWLWLNWKSKGAERGFSSGGNFEMQEEIGPLEHSLSAHSIPARPDSTLKQNLLKNRNVAFTNIFPSMVMGLDAALGHG